MWSKPRLSRSSGRRLPGATDRLPFQQVDAMFLGTFDLGNNGA
jgi:hypothetical protein